jgi:hypothetical protein
VVHSVLLRTALIGALAATTLPATQAWEPPVDPATGKPRPIMNREGYPIAPVGEKKQIPLDWLID